MTHENNSKYEGRRKVTFTEINEEMFSESKYSEKNSELSNGNRTHDLPDGRFYWLS